MENKKKKDASRTEETPASQAVKRGPVKTFLADNVSASVFEREHVYKGQPTKFYSVSFTRSYKDSSGVFKYVKSFDLDDLGKVVTVAQQASEYIRGLIEQAS